MLILVASACAAVIVFSGVRWVEAFVLNVVQPPRGEVRSVSNVILATAFGAVLYLWLDLRATRAALTGIERSQVVVETQLALAADVQRRLLPVMPSSLDHVRWAS